MSFPDEKLETSFGGGLTRRRGTLELVPYEETHPLRVNGFALAEGEIQNPAALSQPTPSTKVRFLDLGRGRGLA